MRALHLANIIINYAIDMNKPVTHSELQGILYALDLAHLKEYGSRLIEEHYLASVNGPRLQSIYEKFSFYNRKIKLRRKDKHKLPDYCASDIERQINDLINLDTLDIISRGVLENSPWSKIYTRKNSSDRIRHIPNSLLLEYVIDTEKINSTKESKNKNKNLIIN